MKYIANPVVVDAFKIVAVFHDPSVFGPSANPPPELILDDGSKVKPTPEMCARMIPIIGDYWVIQSDGYIYLNPKDVFERKYSPEQQQAGAAAS